MNAAISLADHVPTEFAPHCRRIWLGDHPVFKGDGMLVPSPRLVEHQEKLLTAMRQLYAGNDVRALLSQWSKYYFSLVIPAVVVAALVLRRSLCVALNASALVLRDGMPHTLWLPADALGAVNEDPAVRYRSLCVEHLAPQIEALAAAVRVAPRVLWNNAANSLEYALSTLAPGAPAVEDIAFLFAQREFFDTGRPNPLRNAIRYVTPHSPYLPDPLRVRRVCCLRDQLPGEDCLCSSCPLLLHLPEPAIAEQMRLMNQCEKT